jgi:maltose 6'-phosphate phosphatase
MKLLKRAIAILSLAIIGIIPLACSKEQNGGNQKPELSLNTTTDGLGVTLRGSATDPDGKVTGLMIKWGDDLINTYANNDFSSINISHTYILPAAYTIMVTAIDDNGDITVRSIPLTVDFKETLLDGIKESLFKLSDKEFLVFTLNMHTYQETQQNEKFNLITDVIGKMDVDFIALQECAQNKSSVITSGIIREDNMALIITARLKDKYNADYNYAWNWAHYGWTVWEEGVAVLSKHALLDSDDRYISTSTGTNSITSRKTIYGSYQLPFGRINVFSAHAHWRTSLTDEEQNNQILNIKSMVAEKEALSQDAITFVCGDFNGNPTSEYPWSEGYATMMKDNDYADTFKDVYPDANTVPALAIYNTIGGDLPGRIDYIFMKKNAHYQVVDSQIIFKNDIVGQVSDHFGVLTKIRFTE